MNDFRRGLRTLIDIAWKADRPLTATIVFLTLLESANSALSGLWLKLVTDGVLEGDSRKAMTGAVAFGMWIIIFGSGALVSDLLRSTLMEKATLLMERRLLGTILSVPTIEHLERPEYLDKVELVRTEARVLVTSAWAVVDLASLGVQIVVTGLLLATIHPLMLLLPAFALPSFWTGRRVQKLSQKLSEETAETSRLERELFTLSTSAGAAKELRVFRLQDEISSRAGSLWETIVRQNLRTGVRSTALSSLGWSVFGLGYLAAVGFAIFLALQGEATPGDIVLVLMTGMRVQGHVGGVIGFMTQAMSISKSIGRYLWLIDYSDATMPKGERIPPPAALRSGIVFEGVTFRYPDTERDVLRDVGLELPAGSTVAIVGDNGAGKTSLVKMLCGFYRPTEGRILVDGIDLDDIDVVEWRKRISGAFQDFVKFEFSVAETVGIGDLPRLEEPGAVLEAIGRAEASDVLPGLPAGIDTQLGKLFSGGVELSVGQWQKLALSRAMMREEPLVLVLDEPTSSLDASTEHHLFQRYAAAAREAARSTGAITVLVSHRFSTVRMADLIVVIEDGEVIEAGTHAHLVARGGTYAELYELQARAYR